MGYDCGCGHEKAYASVAEQQLILRQKTAGLAAKAAEEEAVAGAVVLGLITVLGVSGAVVLSGKE